MAINIIIKTNIATEYTYLNEVFSFYAMMIRKRISEYKEENLTPLSESIISLEMENTKVLNYFLRELQEIEGVEVICDK